MATRSEFAPNYKTMVKRTFVTALQQVFGSNYPDLQFRGLRIVPEYPQSKPDYAAVYVRMGDSNIYPAGVGHREEFPDANGDVRRWRHNRFETSIEFNVMALTPLDRDVLTDCLLEILTFGDRRHDPSGLNPLTIEDALAKFFYVLYGSPEDPWAFASMLSQIMLNTDEVSVGGESASIAQWQAEDVLIYSNTIDVVCHGGYYNTRPTDRLQLIGNAVVYPYEFDQFYPLNTTGTGDWVTPTVYEDDGVVVGRYAEPPINVDAGTVTGVADVYALTHQSNFVDAAVARGVAAPLGSDTRQSVDAGTVVGIAAPTAAEDATGVHGGVTVDCFHDSFSGTPVNTSDQNSTQYSIASYNGDVYLWYQEADDGTNNRVHYLRIYNGSTLGSPILTVDTLGTLESSGTDRLSIDQSNGHKAVIYQNGDHTWHVKADLGSGFVNLGGDLRPDPAHNVFEASVLAWGGKVFAGVAQFDASFNEIPYALHWNGSSWDTSASLLQDPDATVSNVKLWHDATNTYMSWIETNYIDFLDSTNNLVTMRWVSGSTWTLHSTFPGQSFDALYDFDAGAAPNGDLWIVTDEYDGAGTSLENVYAYKWNGSAWVQQGSPLGINVTIPEFAENPNIVFTTGNLPSVVFNESYPADGTGSNPRAIWIAHWSGSAWTRNQTHGGTFDGIYDVGVPRVTYNGTAVYVLADEPIDARPEANSLFLFQLDQCAAASYADTLTVPGQFALDLYQTPWLQNQAAITADHATGTVVALTHPLTGHVWVIYTETAAAQGGGKRGIKVIEEVSVGSYTTYPAAVDKATKDIGNQPLPLAAFDASGNLWLAVGPQTLGVDGNDFRLLKLPNGSSTWTTFTPTGSLAAYAFTYPQNMDVAPNGDVFVSLITSALPRGLTYASTVAKFSSGVWTELGNGTTDLPAAPTSNFQTNGLLRVNPTTNQPWVAVGGNPGAIKRWSGAAWVSETTSIPTNELGAICTRDIMDMRFTSAGVLWALWGGSTVGASPPYTLRSAQMFSYTGGSWTKRGDLFEAEYQATRGGPDTVNMVMDANDVAWVLWGEEDSINDATNWKEMPEDSLYVFKWDSTSGQMKSFDGRQAVNWRGYAAPSATDYPSTPSYRFKVPFAHDPFGTGWLTILSNGDPAVAWADWYTDEAHFTSDDPVLRIAHWKPMDLHNDAVLPDTFSVIVSDVAGSIGTADAGGNATSVATWRRATQTDSLLLAVVVVDGPTTTITPPAGWALADTRSVTPGMIHGGADTLGHKLALYHVLPTIGQTPRSGNETFTFTGMPASHFGSSCVQLLEVAARGAFPLQTFFSSSGSVGTSVDPNPVITSATVTFGPNPKFCLALLALDDKTTGPVVHSQDAVISLQAQTTGWEQFLDLATGSTSGLSLKLAMYSDYYKPTNAGDTVTFPDWRTRFEANYTLMAAIYIA